MHSYTFGVHVHPIVLCDDLPSSSKLQPFSLCYSLKKKELKIAQLTMSPLINEIPVLFIADIYKLQQYAKTLFVLERIINSYGSKWSDPKALVASKEEQSTSIASGVIAYFGEPVWNSLRLIEVKSNALTFRCL